MSTAQVTLKVTPNELQVIDEALKLLIEVSTTIARNKGLELSKTWKVNVSIAEYDPRRLAVSAVEIRRNIGLKR